MRRFLLLSSAGQALLFVTLTFDASAQAPSAFTAEDMARVASVTILDVSEDGRRIAAAVRRPADNETVDHRRYGDPTYLTPSQVTLQIVDARSGEKEQPFKTLVNVRDAAWSRDGRQLAILLARGPATADAFPSTALYVWDADRRSLRRSHGRRERSGGTQFEPHLGAGRFVAHRGFAQPGSRSRGADALRGAHRRPDHRPYVA